jgi:hypothetical protein
MNNSARSRRVAVSADGRGQVSQAGAVRLWETLRVTGLGQGLSPALQQWRASRAVHDPGKVVADLAGPVASGRVVSRLVRSLAGDRLRAARHDRHPENQCPASASGHHITSAKIEVNWRL